MYIIALCSLVATPIVALVDNELGRFLAISLCIMVGVTATEVVLFVPKIYMLVTGKTLFWKKRGVSAIIEMSSTTGSSNRTTTMSQVLEG